MPAMQEEVKNFVERIVITTNPQQAIAEYFLSKKEQRSDIKKYPEWDVPRVCPATEVIKARRELLSAEKELITKRVEQKARRRDMDEQWNEMRHQELLLRHSFIKFNKFVRENYEKRERAEQKIKDERERKKKRQEEIDELTQKLNYMKSVKEKMQKHVQEYRKYQDYLERVVNETAEFQSVNEIFNRYETLIDARVVLSEHQDEHLQALEDTETEIHHMAEEKSQNLMRLNSRLSLLQSRYEKVKAQALKWETTIARIKDIASAKNLDLTQVKTCCWNIYQQICKRKEIPVAVGRDDVEQQLVHIKRTILELKRIIKVAKKQAAKEEKS